MYGAVWGKNLSVILYTASIWSAEKLALLEGSCATLNSHMQAFKL